MTQKSRIMLLALLVLPLAALADPLVITVNVDDGVKADHVSMTVDKTCKGRWAWVPTYPPTIRCYPVATPDSLGFKAPDPVLKAVAPEHPLPAPPK